MKLLHGTLFVRRFTVDVRSICESVGVDWNGSSDSVICSDNIDIVYHAFFLAMKDYTLDSRGDVGLWSVSQDFTLYHTDERTLNWKTLSAQ